MFFMNTLNTYLAKNEESDFRIVLLPENPIEYPIDHYYTYLVVVLP